MFNVIKNVLSVPAQKGVHVSPFTDSNITAFTLLSPTIS